MIRVFVSRKLKSDSPFYQLLPSEQYEIQGISLLSFKAVDFQLASLSPTPHWLFFYSRRGVDYFLKKEQLSKSSDFKLGAIGAATAASLTEKGYEVDFIGSGDPITTAEEFKQIAAGKNVCFVGAKNSGKSIQRLLSNCISSNHLVVYDNQVKKDIPPIQASILVFTSSLNVQAYYSKYSVSSEQKVIAIGKPTYKTLQKLGLVNVYQAEESSEKGLVEKILDLQEV